MNISILKIEYYLHGVAIDETMMIGISECFFSIKKYLIMNELSKFPLFMFWERERERDGILFFYTLQCVNKVMGGGGGVEMKVWVRCHNDKLFGIEYYSSWWFMIWALSCKIQKLHQP